MKSLVIEKDKLKHNIRQIKKIVEDTGRQENHKPIQIIAVVKGNGYGLGLIEYSKFLIENGINILAVSTVEEAIELRKSGIEKNILMLSATNIKREIEQLIENDITITIDSKEQIDLIEEEAQRQGKKVKAHIKIDTGFGRYGFIYTEKEKIVQALKDLKNIKIEGTFSHFSIAFYEKSDFTEIQFQRFIDVVEFLKENKIETGMLHICNSSAFLRFKGMRLSAVRIGSAFLGRISIPNIYGLKKVGYLKSNVAEIKKIPKGYNIGYSNSYKTKRDIVVAQISCGYADGFNVKVDRDMFRTLDKLRYIVRDFKDSFKNEAIYVDINGEKCRVLGRLGMYHVTAQITGKDVKINDEVKLEVNPIYVDSKIRREYR